MSNKPPQVLDCAKVIEYAIVNDSVTYEERKTFFVGGHLLGEIPKLAICQNLGESEFLLFHCDKDWNVLGAAGLQSIDQAKRKIERSYHGITKEWKSLGTTEEELREFLKKNLAYDACFFLKNTDIES